MKSKRQRLGQHLLSSYSVCMEMVDAAELAEADTVLEIGTGKGILTREIASRNVKKVVTFEVDRLLSDAAKVNLEEFHNVELVVGDAFHSLRLRRIDFQVLISSLPYSRSLDFVRFLSLYSGSFRSAVVLVQDEFARKLLALPGDSNYRAISVLAQIGFNLKIVNRVDRSSFSPPPAVDSVVLKFLPIANRPFLFSNEKMRFLGRLFSFKGRLLRNAIRSTGGEGMIKQMQSDPELMKKRIESLTPAEYIDILEKMGPTVDGTR